MVVSWHRCRAVAPGMFALARRGCFSRSCLPQKKGGKSPASATPALLLLGILNETPYPLRFLRAVRTSLESLAKGF